MSSNISNKIDYNYTSQFAKAFDNLINFKKIKLRKNFNISPPKLIGAI
jgi:hypothetical protein